MYDKPCSIPLRILKLEAILDGRLPPFHPALPEITGEYKRRLAGYRGEKALEFHLSMLPDQKYHIFHNIRLKLGRYYFQIDFLILCSAFAIALEVKNMSGEIIFKKALNQAFWKKNGEVERIKNPVLQTRLQARKLKMWLRQHHITDIPVHYLFVNSNEKTIITTEGGNEQVLQVCCNGEALVDKIEQIASMNKVEKLDSKELKKLRRLLLAKHTPENPDILKQFNLSPTEILSGVKCPPCRYLPMNYNYGVWYCPNCQCKSKTAHIPAIDVYFLLIKPTITNSELREFLHIGSPRVASYLLTSMKIPHTGKLKGRVYHQPDPPK